MASASIKGSSQESRVHQWTDTQVEDHFHPSAISVDNVDGQVGDKDMETSLARRITSPSVNLSRGSMLVIQEKGR